jgi:hypothetical protein
VVTYSTYIVELEIGFVLYWEIMTYVVFLPTIKEIIIALTMSFSYFSSSSSVSTSSFLTLEDSTFVVISISLVDIMVDCLHVIYRVNICFVLHSTNILVWNGCFHHRYGTFLVKHSLGYVEILLLCDLLGPHRCRRMFLFEYVELLDLVHH